MEINKVNNQRSGLKKIKKHKNSQNANFSSLINNNDEITNMNATNNITFQPYNLPLHNEITEPKYENKKDLRSIIENLDELKKEFLTQKGSYQTIENITELISKERIKSSDPELNNILDDVELRAAIELAKLEKKLSTS